MKRIAIVLGLVVLAAANLSAWGDQHGVFRCRATQGTYWEGTAEITAETFRITVHPDYLDVELEWVIKADGAAPPDSFADALEIVGNINLEPYSAVTGLITWYNGDILKGKLKTEEVARSQYEEIVDRTAEIPPPPRDPVLLERTGTDNYDLSVFPVSFGSTRRVRFHYVIPAFFSDGTNRMGYPHAFTDHANVSIRTGTGVASYRLETYAGFSEYDNAEYRLLDASAYDFQAYCWDGNRIDYVVPVLKRDAGTSKFYVGAVDTDSLDSEMVHVTVMPLPAVLAAAGLKEDYVILWRWNHPHILRKYARQIVRQSGLLLNFLNDLDAADKRAALLIDIEGGERISFSMSAPGGQEYDRMLAYLDVLAAQAVTAPPVSVTARTDDPEFNIEAAFGEFEAALQAARALFDAESRALQHLLVLTAGPRMVYSYVQEQDVDWPDDVRVSLLNSQLRNPRTVTEAPYWPGVALERFVYEHDGGLTVYADVGNGTDTHRMEVTPPAANDTWYCRRGGTRQAHVYADVPLARTVNWSVYRGTELLGGYAETPQVVAQDGADRYACAVGASPHLVSLATHMPSSFAAALGFIDDEYALVALEGDALPAREAALYERSGVPALTSADIHPVDETYALPVADWLAANPPQAMGRYYCWWYWSWFTYAVDVNGAVPEVRILGDDGVDVATATAGAVTEPLAIPVAGEVTAPDQDAYLDYGSASATQPWPVPEIDLADVRAWMGDDGYFTIDLSAFSITERQGLDLVLYELNGKEAYRFSSHDTSYPVLLVPVGRDGIAPGTYILRITDDTRQRAVKIVVW